MVAAAGRGAPAARDWGALSAQRTRLPDAAFAALLAGTPLARAARRCYSARADERALCADGRRAARQRTPRAATVPLSVVQGVLIVRVGARALCTDSRCLLQMSLRAHDAHTPAARAALCADAGPRHPAAPGGSASFSVLQVTRSAPVCVRTGAPSSGRAGSLVSWETSIVWPALLALALCGRVVA